MIKLEPDPDIEPGHQWIILPNTTEGLALGTFLTNNDTGAHAQFIDNQLYVPHNAAVDARIVDLINELAHVRFSAPGLVQLELTEAAPE